jgi:hypothetical protein
MTNFFRFFVFCFFVATGVFSTVSAQRNFTLSGTIRDRSNGETLIGASVLIKDDKGVVNGAVSNVYGFYSISLPRGEYSLTYSFIGYEPTEKTISLTQNTTLSLELRPASTTLSEVVIAEQRGNQRITSNEMSVVKMSIQAIRQIPTLMGEVDIIKAIQLLPGVMATSEGGSGFSVRGGAPDQTLILLDEASVYNAAHALGFFSVFNNDAIKDVAIYKGDFPIQYGGRLSSVLDVRMNDGNLKRFEATGGIGLLSSRLTLEGPIIRNKTSFLMAGRRTYFDLFLPLSENEMAKNVKLYFYDLNAKIVHQFSEKSRLFVSAYNGLDIFGTRLGEYMQFDYGNTTFTTRWNYLLSQKLFSNLTMLYSKYNYTMGAEIGGARFKWLSDLSDIGGKLDLTWFPNADNTVRFGVSSIYHTYSPGFVEFHVGGGMGMLFDDTTGVGNRMELPDNYALENAIYLGNDQKINERFSLKYGIRLSSFSNIGKGTLYNYDENYKVIDTVVYPKGKFYHTHFGFEPRIGAAYVVDDATSVKANYSRTVQYVQLAQTSTGGNPLDMWFPANPNIKPQKADMYALGLFRNFQENKWETSLEFYYKDIFNCIDFKDHPRVMLNPHLYGEIRQGRGKAYGMELMIKRPDGKLNGWISYTLSRSERTIAAINKGRTYLAPFDRTHNFTIVANYKISERHVFSANWVFYTGNAVTFPSAAAFHSGLWSPVYPDDRNDSRMPNYHRLDVSYTIKSKPNLQRRWSYDWNFGLFNAYGRKNPWIINFKQERGSDRKYAEMTYLFGIIPSITFNFKF